MGKIVERLKELGIKLSPSPQPLEDFVSAVQHGDLLFISGQLPMQDGHVQYTGKVGSAVNVKQAYYAAKLCAVNALSIIQAHLGDLDRIVRFIRIGGYVNSALGFVEQGQVVNGASQFIKEVFGEKGRHTRISVGVSELPLNATVQIEFVLAVREESGEE